MRTRLRIAGLLALGLLTMLFAAAPVMAQSIVIDFEQDTTGPKPNGFMSADSDQVAFTDSNGAGLDVNNFGVQSHLQALLIRTDFDDSHLIMDFASPMRGIALDFGNDDPAFSEAGDEAVLRMLNDGALVFEVRETMNRNDAMDQTISFVGAECFDQATFKYDVNPAFGLQEIVDDIVLLTCEVEPRVAQHFRSYRAVGAPASREPITLVDQFGEASVRLGTATQLMTPVEKRRGEQVEPIERPDEHYTCYKIGGADANRTVTVSDQFSDSVVVSVDRPTKLCAPAAKTLEGEPGEPPSDMNHYKCYAVSGAPLVGEQIGLTDQFGSDQVRVLRMKRLCNPVTKQRQGGEPESPPHPGEHLACYQVREPAGFVPLTVFTRDQFRTDTLEVTKPSRLCVPAEKNEGGGDT